MQSDYENTCRTYKELILEVVDTHLHPPADYPCWQEEDADYAHWREKYKEVVGFESEKGKFVHLERINSIDEEFKNVVGRLVRIKRAFLGYDIGGGHLAKNWYDVSNWIDSIKNTHGLTDPLDIRNAICNEMVRQEKEKGLVLEPPGAGGKDKPAHQWKLAVNGTEQKRETSQGLKSSSITLKEVLYIVGAIASIVALWFSLPNYVKDFVKDAFPSKDILYLIVIIVINAFQILGLLASFATLIMFVGWLRNKR